MATYLLFAHLVSPQISQSITPLHPPDRLVWWRASRVIVLWAVAGHRVGRRCGGVRTRCGVEIRGGDGDGCGD